MILSSGVNWNAHPDFEFGVLNQILWYSPRRLPQLILEKGSMNLLASKLGLSGEIPTELDRG